MAKPLLKINCNNKTRRNLLRLCGVSFPLWGLVNALFLMINASEMHYPPYFVLIKAALSFLCLLLGCVGTYTLARANLTSDGIFLSFPGLRRRKFSLDSLTALSVDKGQLQFHFQNPDDTASAKRTEAKLQKLAISRLSQPSRARLLEFLDENARNCIVGEENRQLIEFGAEAETLGASKSVRIPYESHSKLKTFYEVCLSYERFFWYVWLGCCAPLALFMLPLVMFIPYFYYQHYLNKSCLLPEPMMIWVNAWQPLLSNTITPINSSVNSYSDWLSNNYGWAFLIAVWAAIILIHSLRLLARPTAIVLSPQGLQSETGRLGLRFVSSKFLWNELKKVEFLKDAKSRLNDDKLVFAGQNTAPLAVLDLKALSKSGSKELLKKAIELWAPQAELDAGFVETAVAPRQSYTELWLRSLNTPPKRDRLAPLRKGDSLKAGEIRVLETIGAGGQGIAYLAEQRNLSGDMSELVVVKEFILPVYVDRRARLQALERFEHEAQVLGSLRHEQIVSLKDHFVEDHRAYLVLERVNGQSLRKLASAGGLRDQTLLSKITKQMCEVLSYLHSQDVPIVHRDFTPDNLIIDEQGILKLIDFNVAYQSAHDAKTTVVGKHAYMPPEQFAGRPCPQSDIYALGATLYFALSGCDPEPFSQSGLPPDCLDLGPLWGEIIMGCTALSVAHRFESCDQIISLLEGSSDTDLQPGINIEIAEKSGENPEELIVELSRKTGKQ